MTENSGNERFESDWQSLVSILLLYIAKGDGTISELETDKMLALVEELFGLQSSESLALLTSAMSSLDEDPNLEKLRALGEVLSDEDKEDIVVMLLQVIAADGRKEVEEMEKLALVAGVLDIQAYVMHKAYDRYFVETP